jgi:ATP-dependent DNA helicase DinG
VRFFISPALTSAAQNLKMPCMPPRKKKIETVGFCPLCEADSELLRREISLAGGAEVLSAATVQQQGTWSELRVIARGDQNSAPAILKSLRPGDVLLHNHPTGKLKPSAADMNVATICGSTGIGFAIQNNDCRDFYVVDEPFKKRQKDPLDADAKESIISAGGPIAE